MPAVPPPTGGRYPLHQQVDVVTARRAGEANPRGSLENPTGLFVLREDLALPGEMPLEQAVALVLAEWRTKVDAGEVSHAIVTTYSSAVEKFVAVAQTRGAINVGDLTYNMALAWVRMPNVHNGAPIGYGTMLVRRSGLRAFFATCHRLGITDNNPAGEIVLSKWHKRTVRNLTDNQIEQLRLCARTSIEDTRTPAALALVMSGASTGEIVFLTTADVDLGQGCFWVHDGGYRSRDRWVPFYDDWCADAVARHITAVTKAAAPGTDPWLIYRPHKSHPTRDRQAASGPPIITALMKTARIHQPGQNRAESIREWLALKVWEETGSLYAVGNRLGMSSLDAVAHLVDLDWTDQDCPNLPRPAHRPPPEGGDLA